MNHQAVHEQLWLLPDRELPEVERRALLAHLDQCAACREVAQRSEAISRVLARMPAPEPSEAFVSRVMERVPAHAKPAAIPRWRPEPWQLVPRLGFGLAVLALGIVLLKPAPVVGTESLLFAGVPDDARWAFSAEPPGTGVLLEPIRGSR